jgi:hypothetical protein
MSILLPRLKIIANHRTALIRNANLEEERADFKLCRGGIQRTEMGLKREVANLYIGNFLRLLQGISLGAN